MTCPADHPADHAHIPSQTIVPGLGPLESAIMTAAWAAGQPLTIRSVLGRLGCYRGTGGSPPAYTTVLSIATILWRKGLLARVRKPGRYGHHPPWWYYPRLSREEYLAGVIRAALACAPDPAAVLRLAHPGSPPPAAGTAHRQAARPTSGRA